MAALYFYGILAVNYHGSVLGNILVREMYHYVLPLEIILQVFYVDCGNVTLCLKSKRSRLSCRLSCKDRGRNNSDNIPAIACAVCTSAGGYNIGIITPCQASERNLKKMSAMLKIVYSTY